jgi:cytoskeleton protein RodZ
VPEPTGETTVAPATPPPAGTVPFSSSTVPATAGDAAAAAKAQATTPAAPAADQPAAVTLQPGQVSLQLKFSGDSWVEVFDGSGKAVLYDLGKAGTERTLTAAAPLSVTIGNAASVTVAVNGKALQNLPRAPGQVLARFSIGPDGSLR